MTDTSHDSLPPLLQENPEFQKELPLDKITSVVDSDSPQQEDSQLLTAKYKENIDSEETGRNLMQVINAPDETQNHQDENKKQKDKGSQENQNKSQKQFTNQQPLSPEDTANQHEKQQDSNEENLNLPVIRENQERESAIQSSNREYVNEFLLDNPHKQDNAVSQLKSSEQSNSDKQASIDKVDKSELTVKAVKERLLAIQSRMQKIEQEQDLGSSSNDYIAQEKQAEQSSLALQSNLQNEGLPPEAETKQFLGKITKNCRQLVPTIVHDKKVYDVMEKLRKNDPEHPIGSILEERKLIHKDLSASKQINPASLIGTINLVSNVISMTVGESAHAELDDETEKLAETISQLKSKLAELSDKPQLLKQESAEQAHQSMTATMSETAARKMKSGRLYKKFDTDISNSRVSEQVQTQYSSLKPNIAGHIVNSEARNAQARTKFSSTMGCQKTNNDNEFEKEGVNQKSFFRVKRQGKPGLLMHLSHRYDNLPAATKGAEQQTPSEKQNQNNLVFKEEDRLDIATIQKYDFTEDLGQKIENQFIDIGQICPQSNWKQRELIQLANLTFIKFGIDIYSEQATLSIKKYKNCVVFSLDSERNILWYYEGRFYFGGWRVLEKGEGEKHGQGYEYVPEKYFYVGQFEANHRSGHGSMKSLSMAHEFVYEGEWLNNNKHGLGRQVEANGIDYIGDWHQGRKNGFGKMKIANEDYYEGNFLNGLKSGEGAQSFKNGDYYKGQYLNGKFHGKGVYLWANNAKYEGEFQFGLRHGRGVWQSNSQEPHCDKYEGQYDNDKKEGFGVYTWKDGTIYEGEFANDLKHGEGAINYGNGKIIKYQWINGTAVTKKAEMRIANRSETSNKTQPIGTISHEKRRGISAFKEKYPKSRSGNGSQLPDRQSRESKILLKFNNI